MLRVLLVRHGQSEWNAIGRWQGQADPPLSDLGRHQAAHAAERVGAVDAIVASDLARARETAEIVAELVGIGPVVVDPRLRERHAGEWQGLTRAEIEEGWPGYLAGRRRPPGWEPDEAVLARALDALADLRGLVGAGDVLVVTHGGLVYALEGHLGASFAPLANLSGRWLDVDDQGGLRLGDRVVLVDPDEVTVPRQL